MNQNHYVAGYIAHSHILHTMTYIQYSNTLDTILSVVLSVVFSALQSAFEMNFISWIQFSNHSFKSRFLNRQC